MMPRCQLICCRHTRHRLWDGRVVAACMGKAQPLQEGRMQWQQLVTEAAPTKVVADQGHRGVEEDPFQGLQRAGFQRQSGVQRRGPAG